MLEELEELDVELLEFDVELLVELEEASRARSSEGKMLGFFEETVYRARRRRQPKRMGVFILVFLLEMK